MAAFRGQLLSRRQAKAFLVFPRLFFPQESAILHANHKSYIEHCINFYFNSLDLLWKSTLMKLIQV